MTRGAAGGNITRWAEHGVLDRWSGAICNPPADPVRYVMAVVDLVDAAAVYQIVYYQNGNRLWEYTISDYQASGRIEISPGLAGIYVAYTFRNNSHLDQSNNPVDETKLLLLDRDDGSVIAGPLTAELYTVPVGEGMAYYSDVIVSDICVDDNEVWCLWRISTTTAPDSNRVIKASLDISEWTQSPEDAAATPEPIYPRADGPIVSSESGISRMRASTSGNPIIAAKGDDEGVSVEWGVFRLDDDGGTSFSFYNSDPHSLTFPGAPATGQAWVSGTKDEYRYWGTEFGGDNTQEALSSPEVEASFPMWINGTLYLMGQSTVNYNLKIYRVQDVSAGADGSYPFEVNLAEPQTSEASSNEKVFCFFRSKDGHRAFTVIRYADTQKVFFVLMDVTASFGIIEETEIDPGYTISSSVILRVRADQPGYGVYEPDESNADQW